MSHSIDNEDYFEVGKMTEGVIPIEINKKTYVAISHEEYQRLCKNSSRKCDKCGKEILPDVDDHSDECLEEIITCKYNMLGCNEEMKRKDEITHLEKNKYHHELFLSNYETIKFNQDLVYYLKDSVRKIYESFLNNYQSIKANQKVILVPSPAGKIRIPGCYGINLYLGYEQKYDFADKCRQGPHIVEFLISNVNNKPVLTIENKNTKKNFAFLIYGIGGHCSDQSHFIDITGYVPDKDGFISIAPASKGSFTLKNQPRHSNDLIIRIKLR